MNVSKTAHEDDSPRDGVASSARGAETTETENADSASSHSAEKAAADSPTSQIEAVTAELEDHDAGDVPALIVGDLQGLIADFGLGPFLAAAGWEDVGAAWGAAATCVSSRGAPCQFCCNPEYR